MMDLQNQPTEPRLRRYLPATWDTGPLADVESAARCVRRLTALLQAVTTYLPRDVAEAHLRRRCWGGRGPKQSPASSTIILP
jgi:hypothetical protein